jgi:glutamate formiminotransferase / formiminotetrahydrofolate cyclodeaminase
VREQGRGSGQTGRLRAVQGMGWWLDEANLAQVSLNITDHTITPLHVAFNEVSFIYTRSNFLKFFI